jgi:DNA mismatch repair protein MutS2
MHSNLLRWDQDSDLIDWKELGQNLAGRAHFEKVALSLQTHPEAQTREQIEEAYRNLNWSIRELDQLVPIMAGAFGPMTPDMKAYTFIEYLEKSALLDFPQINRACLLLESYSLFLHSFPKTLPPFFGDNDLRSQTQQAVQKIVKTFRRFVTPDGEVLYERHPELAPIFQKISGMEQTLRHKIMAMARDEKFSSAVQMDTYDVIHDRYCLAIKSDSYRGSMGFIVSRSNTGNTLYIEPFELRELSNQRVQLIASLEEAIFKICQQYVTLLAGHADFYKIIWQRLLLIDEYRAKALFCESYQLRCPKLTTQFEVYLRDFFHPLIEDPVTNTIYLKDQEKGMIISGPNTGGKTVSMKAVCLALLFMHKGLFVPAAEATLPVVKGLFFIGHDQQNLMQGLSSFAAEVTNYLKLLDLLEETNVIFIDEIFNSTGSDEASALAVELFEEINSRSRTKIVVSTHHHLLKTLMHAKKDYQSAHVEIDLSEHRPTYRLLVGDPGSSHAFSIFSRIARELNKDGKISERAKILLGSGKRPYEQLVEEVGMRRHQLEKELREAAKIRKELANQKEAQEGVLFLKTQERLKEIEGKVKEWEHKAKGLLHEAKVAKGQRQQLDNQFAEIRQQVILEKGEPKAEDQFFAPKIANVPNDHVPAREVLAKLKSGMMLYSTQFGKVVELVHPIPKRNALSVRVGSLKLDHTLDNLFAPLRKQSSLAKSVSISYDVEVDGTVEIDGRGMRLPDFERKVEQGLVQLQAGHIPYLLVIHGHGDGILKKWLRDYLAAHPHFSWRPEEGNDGATHIEGA